MNGKEFQTQTAGIMEIEEKIDNVPDITAE